MLYVANSQRLPMTGEFERAGNRPRAWISIGMCISTLIAGCGRSGPPSPKPGPEEFLFKAPGPSLQEVGVGSEEFYFEYVLEGGYHGSVSQVLVVTSAESLDLDRLAKLRGPDPFVPNWKEVYVIPDSSAKRLELMLGARGVFGWESIIGDSRTDSYVWEVLLSASGKRHRIRIVSVSNEIILASEKPRGERSVAGGALEDLAIKVFNLIDDIRSEAKAHGRLLYQEEQEEPDSR